MPNRLINARSTYLRKAADQLVDWYEWGDEAFDQAKRTGKPILLSIGGVWCHWCHVMAHESFEDANIAAAINNSFVPVKVDRDERPDIDRRYQDVIIRIAGAGGWPLTAFLTPEGKAFFGGTYFPPEDRWGRPGLTTVMRKLLEIYTTDRWRITTIAEEIYKGTAASSSVDMRADIPLHLLESAPKALLALIDNEHGGFGTAPKFHHATGFEYLIDQYCLAGDEEVGAAIKKSLDAMAAGGIYDHLLGGFFRYSTDQQWIVPHFEKMLADNAELLKLYAIAASVFDIDRYRTVVHGIVDYYRAFGRDNRCGFYASQDADIGLLDEGGYYTFSLQDIASFLTEDEAKAACLHYDIMPTGEMHDRPSQNVLFIAKSPAEVARTLSVPLERVDELIASARVKMRQFRETTREQPFIDSTVYTNYNGLMIEGLAVAGTLLERPDYVELSEGAAQFILGQYMHNDLLLHRDGTDGFAEDYVFLAKGLLALCEATQNTTYLEAARRLIDKAIDLYWDSDKWGFLDARPGDQGYLSIAVKNIQDAPVQSVNGIAPVVLILLASLTDKTSYVDYAEKTLRAFAAVMENNPMVSHSYLLSLLVYSKGVYKIETSAFFEKALRVFRPFRFVLRKEVDGVVVCEKDTCRVFSVYPPDEKR